jgi:serine phosphatase RsbU (regulator of sigma subunit)
MTAHAKPPAMMALTTNEELTRSTDGLFQDRFAANARRVDRLFAIVMVAQWALGIVFALTISANTWVGREQSTHVHVYLAVFLGAGLSSLPIFLAIARPGWIGTRYTIAIAQMLWSALLIHLTGGRVETHFHVFGSLAFLAFYRDWTVLLPATLVVAADHLVRQLFWPESVYGVASVEWWRFLEHAGWVVFEDFFLVIACVRSKAEMREFALQQVAIELHERAAAAKLQTSILPSKIDVTGLEASAQMQTADTVGGDFYDVLPVDGGCWIAIGDVAGHGTRAGLTMLRAQAALAALIRHAPQATPGELWQGLNRTYVANIRERLAQDDHMTLSLLRYYHDGRVLVVGAHEEAIVWRAREKTCELIPIIGTWIGIGHVSSPKAIERATETQAFQLEPGDLLVLYTDGIIEAKGADGRMLGVEAVTEVVTTTHARSVAEIRDAIFALGSQVRNDDASVLVFRYVGVEDAAVAAA